MNVTVNGEPCTIADGATVATLMEERGLTNEGTAVAVDATVVPSATWAEHTLHEGATIDILTAVQGG